MGSWWQCVEVEDGGHRHVNRDGVVERLKQLRSHSSPPLTSHMIDVILSQKSFPPHLPH
jgi:hypothetical protein